MQPWLVCRTGFHLLATGVGHRTVNDVRSRLRVVTTGRILPNTEWSIYSWSWTHPTHNVIMQHNIRRTCTGARSLCCYRWRYCALTSNQMRNKGSIYCKIPVSLGNHLFKLWCRWRQNGMANSCTSSNNERLTKQDKTHWDNCNYKSAFMRHCKVMKRLVPVPQHERTTLCSCLFGIHLLEFSSVR